MVSDKTQSATEYVTVEIKTSPDDPYSYVVKEEYDRTLEYYSKFPEMDFKSEYYYFIYDINGDGIEELLIGSPILVGGGELEEHRFETEIMIEEIYTIIDDKAVGLATMSVWRPDSSFERTILDNGFVRYVGGTPECLSYLYMKYEGSEMMFYELINQGSEWYYSYLASRNALANEMPIPALENELYQQKAKRKEITPEEFDRLRAEIEGDAKPVEIEWKNIDQYGR